MKHLSTMPLLLSLASLQALPAQSVKTFVSPKAYAAKEGSGGNVFPFGLGNPFWRYQQIHRDLPASVGFIQGLAWRRNGTSFSPFRAFSFELKLEMATAASSSMSKDFAANMGKDKTAVVFGSVGPGNFLRIHWPATVHTTAPAPFAYQIPFKVPFLYKKKPLVWEVKIMNRPATGGGSFDFAYDNALGRVKWAMNMRALTVTSYGRGCTASDQGWPALASLSGVKSGNAWKIYFSGKQLKCNSSALLFLGIRKDRWGAVPLPFLLPGTKCSLLLAPAAALGPTATSAMGAALITVKFQDRPEYKGAVFFCQWLGVDPGSPLGVILSDALQVQFPGWTGKWPDRAEYVWPAQGLVTRFTYR